MNSPKAERSGIAREVDEIKAAGVAGNEVVDVIVDVDVTFAVVDVDFISGLLDDDGSSNPEVADDFNNFRNEDDDVAKFGPEVDDGFGGNGRVGVEDVRGTASSIASKSASVVVDSIVSTSEFECVGLIVVNPNGLTSGPEVDVVDVVALRVVETTLCLIDVSSASVTSCFTTTIGGVEAEDVVRDVVRDVVEVVVLWKRVVVVGDMDVVLVVVDVVVKRNLGIFDIIIGGNFLQSDDGDELETGNDVVDSGRDSWTDSVIDANEVVDLIVDDAVDASVDSSSAVGELHLDDKADHHEDGCVVDEGGEVGFVHQPYAAVGRDTNASSTIGVTVHQPGRAVGAPSFLTRDVAVAAAESFSMFPSTSRMHASSPLCLLQIENPSRRVRLYQ